MDIEALINFQLDISCRIAKDRSNFKKSPKARINKVYLDNRLEILDQNWYEFLSGHKELFRHNKSKDLADTDYVKLELYEKTQECFMDYKCELKDALSDLVNPKSGVSSNSNETSNNNSSSAFIQLPKITIQPFSGGYSEWTTFRDLFKSVIHGNSSLSNVQKLHYLKGYLTGEAEQILRFVPLVENNYERSWKLLEERYDNKKYICHHILKQFLSQKNISNESAGALKDLIDTTNDCLASLSSIGVNIESWDILVIHILTLKLDAETRRQWEFNVANMNTPDELPTYAQFKEFLTNRYRAIEFLEPKSSFQVKGQKSYGLNKNQNVSVKSMHVTEVQCTFCSDNHKLYSCKKFAQEDIDVRRSFVYNNKICFLCLGSNHSAAVCKNQGRCKLCGRKHHSLVHPKSNNVDDRNRDQNHASVESDAGASQAQASTSQGENSVQVVSHFSSDKVCGQVLLATAVIKAMSGNGEYYSVRALLDQGSQSSFITEATVQYLGLKRIQIKGQISSIGGNSELISKGMVNIKLKSRFDPQSHVEVKAFILNSITTQLPSTKMEIIDWVELDKMQLADPGYNTPSKIDILLGAEVYSRIIQDGIKKDAQGSLVAQATSFGWILSGTVDIKGQGLQEVKVMHCCLDQNEILKKFWELESDIELIKEQVLTEDELLCEKHYKETTQRQNDVRYVVQLPFKEENPIVMNSKKIAESRLKSLERRLGKDSTLRENYKNVMNEYLNLNHMKVVASDEKENSNANYLPHHAVGRDDKDTTRVRVVFDASCKGGNGVSLNYLMRVGQRLQPDLRQVSMRWRLHPVCLVAAIVKRYRQVQMHENHSIYQRILWRESTSEEIQEYELTTVTFGTVTAPNLAVKTLQQLADDKKDTLPDVSEIVKTNFDKDDLLTGAENAEEARKMYIEINNVLKRGGFILQKWASNCIIFNDEINDIDNVDNGRLGLTWNRIDDIFGYKVSLPSVEGTITKRKNISDDWVGPSTILNKLIIQKLWLGGIDWDQEVPNQILHEWRTYREEFPVLSELGLPRWVKSSRTSNIELNGFCNASKFAYAAVVYARTINQDGLINVSLKAARTKVAPLKQESIPRLELCGAVFLTKLVKVIDKVLVVPKISIHAWTDSTIVLAWLYSHPSRWKVFVPNRVSKIITTLDSYHWSVESKSNPKDHLKRVIGNTTLKFAEMSTLLAQIKECLNSRPIPRFSDVNNSGVIVLTPGNFLVGESLLAIPDYNFESLNVGLLRRWQYTQRMVQDFWRQWSQDYLTKFLHRYKWNQNSLQPKIDDIVVVKEDNIPPSKWLYGRIVALHPGLDHIIRVVTLKTKDSLIKRPTCKICILPVVE